MLGVALLFIAVAQAAVVPWDSENCDRDVSREYRSAVDRFHTNIYKVTTKHHLNHFVMSQHSIWLMLAALAEGADGNTQQELFKALYLPNSRCLREKYYQIATSREPAGDDVLLSRKRYIIFDEGVKLNDSWAQEMKGLGLLDYDFAPIKTDRAAVAKKVQDIIGLKEPIAESSIQGNSMIVDSLDYEGLWTQAFKEPNTDVAPFFDDDGTVLGDITYLTMKKRVKLAYIKSIHSKVVDLPVGKDGRYRMLFLINLANHPISSTIELYTKSAILDIMENQEESLVPIEIAIPKFTETTVLDVSKILNEVGVQSLWTDEAATRFVSEPAALPGSFIQRVTLKMDNHAGIDPHPEEIDVPELETMETGLSEQVGKDFIANRPFMYGLFDSETKTCLVSGVYSRPAKTD